MFEPTLAAACLTTASAFLGGAGAVAAIHYTRRRRLSAGPPDAFSELADISRELRNIMTEVSTRAQALADRLDAAAAAAKANLDAAIAQDNADLDALEAHVASLESSLAAEAPAPGPVTESVAPASL